MIDPHEHDITNKAINHKPYELIINPGANNIGKAIKKNQAKEKKELGESHEPVAYLEIKFEKNIIINGNITDFQFSLNEKKYKMRNKEMQTVMRRKLLLLNQLQEEKKYFQSN